MSNNSRSILIASIAALVIGILPVAARTFKHKVTVKTVPVIYVGSSSNANFGASLSGAVSTVSSNFWPQAAYVIASNYYVLPNQTFTVNGRNFMPNEPVTVNVMGQTLNTQADAQGNFTSQNITVPFSVINSTQHFSAHGNTSGVDRGGDLTVGTFYPDVQPSSYYLAAGSGISFSGARFAPGEEVSITANGQAIATVKTDNSGNFKTAAFAVNANPGQQVQYNFTGNSSHVSWQVTVWTAAR